MLHDPDVRRSIAVRVGTMLFACALTTPLTWHLNRLSTLRFSDAPATGQFEPLDDRELAIGRAASVITDVWDVSPAEAESIVRASVQEGEERGLPASLLLGIMAAESGFRANARNGYGAVGLMQVVARVHADKLPAGAGKQMLTDPRVNISIGAKVLADCLRATGGNVPRALARYSGNARQYATKVQRFRQAFTIALGDGDTPLQLDRSATVLADNS